MSTNNSANRGDAPGNLTIGEGEGTRESAGTRLFKLRRDALGLYRRGRHGRAV